MNQATDPNPRTSPRQPRGKSSGSVIRLFVLIIILVGVGIFGWIRRPDLFRNYLGINAPAWNTSQALKFANNELFTLGTELTEAEVVFLDQGQSRLADMIENGGGSRTITAETIRNDPAAFGVRCAKTLDQAKRDASRAMAVLDAGTFRTSGDQASLWKTLDLAEQVQRSIGALGTSDLGKTFTEQNADKTIADVIEVLRKIQTTTSPQRRTIDTDAAPPGRLNNYPNPGMDERRARHEKAMKDEARQASEGKIKDTNEGKPKNTNESKPTEKSGTSSTTSGPSEDQKYIATQMLRLSLVNDTATPESVEKELAKGANPKWVDDTGDNLLIKAVNVKEKFKISDIDIDPSNNIRTEGSILDVTGDADWMPPKDPENIARICEILIKAGAEVNQVPRFGSPPLVMSMVYCQTPSAKVMLAAGADPNLATDTSGDKPFSPLGCAVCNQCPEGILLLLDAGAKVDPEEVIYREFKKVGKLMEVARNKSPKLAGTPALAALEKAASDQGKASSKPTDS